MSVFRKMDGPFWVVLLVLLAALLAAQACGVVL